MQERAMRAIFIACTLATGLSAADPRAASIYPFTGQRGTVFTAIARGNHLKDATAVMTGDSGLRVTIEGGAVEPAEPGARQKTPIETARLRIEIPADAAVGRHMIRLVTPGGISNALPILVADSAVAPEPEGLHETPDEAIALGTVPTVRSGRISQRGEADLYTFDAKAGETLTFQIASGLPSIGAAGGNANGFDPSLTLLEPSGSWFDQGRLNRIAFNDEPLWVLGRLTDAHLVHTFPKAGRYFLRVEAFSGQGGADYGYQLRVNRGALPPEAPPAKSDWEERTYTRKLSANRMNELAARGGMEAKKPTAETYRPGSPVKLPAQIEGTIAQPGEWHRSTFTAEGPQDIAIEIETPETAPPLFNPVVRVLNEKGEEVVTNAFAGRGACTGALTKSLTAKTIYPIRNAGTYTVEVRDVTADLGSADFRFRVQIRPQVPHIGGVRIEEDHVNLAPGAARTFRVSFDREEGYRGAVAVQVEGLPAGVTAMAAADFEPDKDPPPYPGKRERYVPRTERTVVALAAAPDAQPTATPVMARVTVRPVQDGRPGPVIANREIPIMVVTKP